MTLDRIIRIAQKQGQDDISMMQKATGKEVLSILDAATKEVEAMMSEARASTLLEAERIGNRLISAANLESRKRILESREEVLQKVRDGAMEKLRNLSIIERERMMRRLLSKARNLIPEGTVCVRSEDMDILKDNLGSYRVGPPTKISGGIIVNSLDRRKRLDLSFETLFDETWDRNFSDITHFLFREGKE